MLRLQLVRREKRGLELREAALRAQGPAHVLLLEQLRWEQAQLGAGGASSSGSDSSGGGSSGDEEEVSQVSGASQTWWRQEYTTGPGALGPWWITVPL